MKKTILISILMLIIFSTNAQIVNRFRDSTWFKKGVQFDKEFTMTKDAEQGKVLVSEANGLAKWKDLRKVDTIYKNLDSIIFKINGLRYSIKDSTGTARIDSTTSSATPAINTDNVDTYMLTAQAVNITSFTTNLSGTPTNDQILHIVIKGTAARTITWGSSFEASTVALPTTTVSTDRLDVYFIWNTFSNKWRCGGVW